jgi:polyhydroxyalkanoate synthesis regulator phasin
MPQPKKTGSKTTRKPAASKPATRKPAAKPKAGKPTAAKPKARAPRAAKPKGAPAATTPPPASEDLAANLGVLRDRLVSSLTITTDRLQDAVDDAVRRGRMTRKDAEDLLSTLVAAGRAQSEALLADVEQLLGRSSVRVRKSHDAGDAVLRTVDRARRRVGVGGGGAFPILGYDDLTAAQVTKRLADLTPAQLRKVRDYERRYGARKSILAAIERKLG